MMNGRYLFSFEENFIIAMANTRQLHFAMFCVTSALGIWWQHLNHPNLLVCAVHRFHVYFHVRYILHDLDISLPRENGFSKVKNAYIKSVYYSICDGYGVDADETGIHGD